MATKEAGEVVEEVIEEVKEGKAALVVTVEETEDGVVIVGKAEVEEVSVHNSSVILSAVQL